MKNYIKPVMLVESIEAEDVIASGLGLEAETSAKDSWWDLLNP